MVKVSQEIFKMYDIRGIYGETLTDEVAYLIGKSLGTFFQDKGQKSVVVGRDNRVSGEAVSQNFAKGLLETGCDVIDLGIVVTPFIYFSWYELDAQAAAMVTASHNPPQCNGFKCSFNKKPLVGEDYQRIKEICLSEQYKIGQGNKKTADIWPSYKEKIKSSISLKRKLKVAVDCGNGTAGLFAPELLTELGCEVLPIFCESDGSFPNHQPYPQKTEFYGKLIETIKNEKCDAGIAFDGDGDRLGIYDEQGTFIENDRLAMIFSQDICSHTPNPKIVMNVSTSLSVIDYIKAVGGDLTLWKTGYPYISEKMKEIGAVFGGEISGHFFFSDRYLGFDDALYAAIRALEILAAKTESFSELIRVFPKYFETREFRVEIPAGSDKFALIDKIKNEIKKEYPQVEVLDIDGIRFSFIDGWGLIRASNTEPLLTGRAEARTEEKLKEAKEIIRKKLFENGISLDWEAIK